MMENETNPVLYILMRTDLDSLNPGKAMAQAAHAANDMVTRVEEAGKREIYLCYWEEQAGGFGTTLVLDGGSDENIRQITSTIAHLCPGAMVGVVHDPTYPIKDGEVTHLLPLDTCGWVFGDKSEIGPHLEGMELHD